MACGNYVYGEMSFPSQIQKKQNIKPIAREVFVALIYHSFIPSTNFVGSLTPGTKFILTLENISRR